MNVSHLDFGYLRPPRNVFDIIHKGDYMLQIEGKKYYRRIFYDVFYTQYEGEKLLELRNAAEKAKIVFPQEWTSEESMKFLHAGAFNIKKTIKSLKAHLEWKANLPQNIPTNNILKTLQTGVVYISGRDKEYRPIIVIEVTKIKQHGITLESFMETLSFVLSVAKEYYFVHGKVENWIIIVETNGMGLLDFPFKILKEVFTFAAVNFPCTLEKLYIMNLSKLLKGSWPLIQSGIDQITKQKISIIQKHQYSQLLEKIEPNQLEKRYGGTLQDLTNYWPPINTLNKPPYTQTKKTNLVLAERESMDTLQSEPRNPPNEYSSRGIPEVKKCKTPKGRMPTHTDIAARSTNLDYETESRPSHVHIHTFKSESQDKRSFKLSEAEEYVDLKEYHADQEEASEEDTEEAEDGKIAKKPFVLMFRRTSSIRLSTIREESYEEGATSLMMLQDQGTATKGLHTMKSKQKSRVLLSKVLLTRVTRGDSRVKVAETRGTIPDTSDGQEGNKLVYEGQAHTPGCCKLRDNQEDSCNMF